jgi:hypothetical protein
VSRDGTTLLVALSESPLPVEVDDQTPPASRADGIG